jgi:hypothetical protein
MSAVQQHDDRELPVFRANPLRSAIDWTKAIEQRACHVVAYASPGNGEAFGTWDIENMS